MKKLWLLLGVLCIGLLVCQKPVETGTINVNSTPTGADVFLDDSTTGKKTNCVLEDVPLGRHKVRLVLEGYKTWNREIELTEDDPEHSINATLIEVAGTGAIQVSSDPTGADVYLDDTLTGKKTNCVLDDVATGQHTLRLILEGYYNWELQVTVDEGDMVEVNAVLLPVELDKVTGLTAEATADGAGIHLTWDPVANAETYNVYFNGELLLDGITVTEYTHAEPGMTGVYTVSASAGGQEGPESDPLSTEPIAIQDLTVWELNGAGEAGIGWDVVAEAVVTYYMADNSNADKIDCYFTNWEGIAGGFGGPYSLASPDMLPEDPGDPTGGSSGWRTSGISDPLTQNIEEINLVPPENDYFNYTDVTVGETYAVLTQDDYYALIQVISIDETVGQVDIRTTFQPIQGSRLF